MRQSLGFIGGFNVEHARAVKHQAPATELYYLLICSPSLAGDARCNTGSGGESSQNLAATYWSTPVRKIRPVIRVFCTTYPTTGLQRYSLPVQLLYNVGASLLQVPGTTGKDPRSYVPSPTLVLVPWI